LSENAFMPQFQDGRAAGLPVAVEGSCDRRFAPVRDAFRDNFRERGEVGAAVCVMAGGRVVADLWGERADPGPARRWQPDTLVNMFSEGKGLVAACAARLAGQGRLDVDAAVASCWRLGEHYFTKAQVAEMHSILLGAAAHHVTVIASSGDNGALSDDHFGQPVKEVSLPASDPLALAVGGTTLTADPSAGTYIGETTWNQGSEATGGGFSRRYARPAYQGGVPGISTMRGVPDVAGEADPELIGQARHRSEPNPLAHARNVLAAFQAVKALNVIPGQAPAS
jgi:hypothetical protein